MGVWISGFFGSGKSHFLKILSYIIENREINGKKTIKYLQDQIKDKFLVGDLERISSVPTEVILFNIDSKSDSEANKKDDAIKKVFKKVFYEHQGFYSGNFGIANLESQLREDGVFEEYKKQFEQIKGKSWEERRRFFRLDADAVKKALTASTGMSEESAKELHANCTREYESSIEAFAGEVKRYIDDKPKNFHLVFLVDEVGQFIGNDTKLMVNLQTLAEDLGSACEGKVWMMVTSQEAIDKIAGKIKGDDFSKIQGRFDTRLSLTSISANEVIKKRILEKNETADYKLKEIYHEKEAILRNLINFTNATNDYLPYNDEEEFAAVYPFVPYQFKLLQNVFEQVRKHGSAGKHLSEGERSLISAFKESAYAIKDKEEGILIPFYDFYETISEFLNPVITRVVENARINEALKDDPFNINVLIILFMLKYINSIPANLENIATLMVTSIDEDKLALKEKIKKSLQLLLSEILIQKNGDEYIFLTDDEQDINKEIKEMTVEENAMKSKLREMIFDDIFSNRKIKYSKNYDFDFNKKMDEKTHGRQTASIGLNIISPLSDLYDRKENSLIFFNQDQKDVLVKLSDDGDYLEELKESLQITEYIKTKSTVNKTESMEEIINGKAREARERMKRVQKYLEKAIIDATFIINGEKKAINGNSAKEKINNAMNILIENTYWKLSCIDTFRKSPADVNAILSDNKLTQFENTNNKLAIDEVFEHINIEESMNHQIHVKSLMDKFTKIPYGWNELDIAAVIVVLLKEQKIRLRHSGEILDESTTRIAERLIKPSENDKIMVKLRNKVSIELINRTRNVCRKIWTNSDVPDEEDRLAKYIKDRIKSELDEIHWERSKYIDKKYPGESILINGLNLFDPISTIKDNNELFEVLLKNEDSILLWKERMQYVEHFFKKQVSIFDNGKQTCELYDKNKFYIQDPEIGEVYRQLTKILENPEPYRMIKEIPELTDVIMKSIETAVDKIKKMLNDETENHIGSLIKYPSEHKEIEQKIEAAKVQYSELLQRAENTNEITTIEGLRNQSQQIYNRFNNAIEAIIKKQNQTVNEENKHSYPKRTTRKMKYKEFFNISEINTNTDIEQLTDDIAEKLKRILKDNDIELVD